MKAPGIERQEEPIILKTLTILSNKKLEVKQETVHSIQKDGKIYLLYN